VFEAFFSGKRLFFLPFCVSLERLDGTNELPLVVEAAMMTTSAVLSFCNANILYFYGATFWSQNTTPEFLRHLIFQPSSFKIYWLTLHKIRRITHEMF